MLSHLTPVKIAKLKTKQTKKRKKKTTSNIVGVSAGKECSFTLGEILNCSSLYGSQCGELSAS